MAATREIKSTAAAQPRSAKEKKPKDKKPKTAKTASHPPYFEMIKEALLALDEKSGSSPYAIAKYMEEKHKAALPANFRKILSLQLKNSATKGKLTKVKASYKLSGVVKKDKPAVAKKAAPAPKKAVAVAKAAPKKATAAAGSKRKAEAVKKVAPKKKGTPTKAKQPKSIKSPAAKKARKVAAV